MSATAVEMPEIGATGLTPKEVVQRIESGQSNAVKTSSSRSVQDIVRANVFTLFNGIIFAAMVLVLITGSWRTRCSVSSSSSTRASASSPNSGPSARWTGYPSSWPPTSSCIVTAGTWRCPTTRSVLDDLLWIRAGEQVPADGQIIQNLGTGA